MGAGGISLDVTAIDVTYMAAGETVILAEGGRYERRTIDSISASTLTFTEANGATPWPVGTRVYAALPAYLADTVDVVKPAADTLSAELRFDIDPGKDYFVPPAPAPVTFNGYEVFDRFPLRAEPVTSSHRSNLEMTDMDYGPVATRRPRDFPVEVMSMTVPACDAAKARLVEDVFERAEGRLGEFYMPTWENDLRIVSTAAAGQPDIVVDGEEVAAVFSGHPVYRSVAVRFTDNTWEYNTAQSFAAAGGNTTITMQANWSRTIDPANVRRISWMPLWRFETDELTTEWNLLGNHAYLNPTLRTLKDPSI